MAGTASSLDLPLHSNFRILAQRCRGILRKAHQATIEARRLLIGRRLASSNQSLRRRTQRRTKTLHLDCKSRQNYPGRQTRAPSVKFDPLDLWPQADRNAWNTACRPAARLKRGGAAGHLKPITRDDLARRYGYFLDFLDRRGLLPAGRTGCGECNGRQRRGLHRRAERSRKLRDGLRLDLQAAACGPVHGPGPRFQLAC